MTTLTNHSLASHRRASITFGKLPAQAEAPTAGGGISFSKRHWFTVGLSFLLLVAIIMGVSLGAVQIPVGEIIGIIAAKLGIVTGIEFTPLNEMVFWKIRLPRILAGVMIGAALGLSGAMIQGLFRNPLAEPGLIGTSSGAALAGACFMVFAPVVFGNWAQQNEVVLLPLTAAVGAIVATFLAYGLAVVERKTQVVTLLLVGIALNAMAAAGIGILLFFANDIQQRSINFWLFGSLNGIGWGYCAVLAATILPIAFFVCSKLGAYLDAFSLGESEAHHLGVPMEFVKFVIIAGSAVIVGVSVAIAGVIAFIGLIVPHIVRICVGPSHRTLLLHSALLGGTLLIVADLVARTVNIPAELPVGALTSMMGAPFFLFLILQQRRRLVG
jgi:iron complex transport system permease protein